MNQNNNIDIGAKRTTLAQKFNIRTNKGKRDMVWAQKRQMKFDKYEQLMQEEQQYYEQQLSPKMTPSNYNNEQYQRPTPSNQQRITNNYQQNNYNNFQNNQRETPLNQQRLTPNEVYYKRGSPNNGQMMNSPYDNQSRNQMNQQRITPSQQYQIANQYTHLEVAKYIT